MARIFTKELILDPTYGYQLRKDIANADAQRQKAFWSEIGKGGTQSFVNAVQPIITDKVSNYKKNFDKMARQDELIKWLDENDYPIEINDPKMELAMQKYVNSGDYSGLENYFTNKEAADERAAVRAAEEAKKAEEKEKEDAAERTRIKRAFELAELEYEGAVREAAATNDAGIKAAAETEQQRQLQEMKNLAEDGIRYGLNLQLPEVKVPPTVPLIPTEPGEQPESEEPVEDSFLTPGEVTKFENRIEGVKDYKSALALQKEIEAISLADKSRSGLISKIKAKVKQYTPKPKKTRSQVVFGYEDEYIGTLNSFSKRSFSNLDQSKKLQKIEEWIKVNKPSVYSKLPTE